MVEKGKQQISQRILALDKKRMLQAILNHFFW